MSVIIGCVKPSLRNTVKSSAMTCSHSGDHPSDHGEVNTVLAHDIYSTLRDRDGHLCCSGEDCRPVEATVLPNGDYYWSEAATYSRRQTLGVSGGGGGGSGGATPCSRPGTRGGAPAPPAPRVAPGVLRSRSPPPTVNFVV